MPRIEQSACCHLSPAERVVVDELTRLTGLNQADTTRLAYWHLARHYDLPLHGEFALRRQKPRAKRRIA